MQQARGAECGVFSRKGKSPRPEHKHAHLCKRYAMRILITYKLLARTDSLGGFVQCMSMDHKGRYFGTK